MPSDKPITEERIRQALVTVAYIISTYGEAEYLPLMERLEQELERYKDGRDPLSRARAILKAYAEEDCKVASETAKAAATT
jgi:hypothetical protein